MSRQAEEVILALVPSEFEIRPDGSIWRVAQRTRTGRRVPVAPRRADPLKSDGYRVVRTQIDGSVYAVGAHRLVWLVLRGPIPPAIEPNHKNGNRGDNRPENLELVTKSENLIHSYRELDRPRMACARNGRAVLTAGQVSEIRSRSSEGESFASLGRAFNVTRRTARLIATGQSWRNEYPV